MVFRTRDANTTDIGGPSKCVRDGSLGCVEAVNIIESIDDECIAPFDFLFHGAYGDLAHIEYADAKSLLRITWCVDSCNSDASRYRHRFIVNRPRYRIAGR